MTNELIGKFLLLVTDFSRLFVIWAQQSNISFSCLNTGTCASLNACDAEKDVAAAAFAAPKSGGGGGRCAVVTRLSPSVN